MTDRSPVRIIACVDTGVDDALALALLLASPDECKLVGVLAGYGNVDAATAERNTRFVLDLFGRSDVPVFRSSTHPSWADAFIPDAGCALFHGADGLGGYVARSGIERFDGGMSDGGMSDGVVSVGGYRTDDPHADPADGAYASTSVGTVAPVGKVAPAKAVAPAASDPEGEASADGVAFLIEQVRRHGRGVTVLATGPLTDVDAALRRAPDIARKLRLVMMGGTLSQPGNCWDAVAETNVIQDPEAADRVFHTGADVTMVGLDVTHRCLLPCDAAARWRATGTARGRFLAAIADFSIAANLEADPVAFAGGMPLHDPLAAAVALDPSLVSCFDVALRAETETGDRTGVRGRTIGDPVGLVTPTSPRVHVALDVDAARFTDGLTARLTALCEA